jgi:hypothetical protein
MQTLFEYQSIYATTPEYRIARPNGCVSFMASVEHDEDEADDFLLERIFALCNHGSGREHEQFKVTPIPSLSVGDYVKLGCRKGDNVRLYRCEPTGWSQSFTTN